MPKQGVPAWLLIVRVEYDMVTMQESKWKTVVNPKLEVAAQRPSW